MSFSLDEQKQVLKEVNSDYLGYGEPSEMTRFLKSEGLIDLDYREIKDLGLCWSVSVTKAGLKLLKK